LHEVERSTWAARSISRAASWGMMPISPWVAAKARSTSSHLRTWLVSEKIAANAGDE